MSPVEAGSPHPSTTMSDSESEHAPSADEADPGHTVTIASQVTHHTVVPPKQGSKAKPKDKKDIKTKELSLVYITGTGKPAGFARVTGWVRVRVQLFGPGRNPYPARVTRHLFWYPSPKYSVTHLQSTQQPSANGFEWNGCSYASVHTCMFLFSFIIIDSYLPFIFTTHQHVPTPRTTQHVNHHHHQPIHGSHR